MKVSVVVPTKNRQQLFPLLYQCFCDQTHADKELLVLDDSPQPSSYFPAVGDHRVRYIHAESGRSLGEKRNYLVRMASGDVVAQFDDDDYYAPDYLRAMLELLGNAHLAKLSGWYVYMAGANDMAGADAMAPPSASVRAELRDTDFFGYWDTTAGAPQCYTLTPNGGVEIGGRLMVDDCNIFGYGFSYVFRKSVLDRARFPDADFGEDYDLVLRMREAGMRINLRPDDQGLVLHMIHTSNCSRVFPQYRMPARWAKNVFGLAVERYVSA